MSSPKSETHRPPLPGRRKCIGTQSTGQLQSPSRPSQCPLQAMNEQTSFCYQEKDIPERTGKELTSVLPLCTWMTISFLPSDHPAGLSSGCSSQDELTELLSTWLSASRHSNNSAPLWQEAQQQSRRSKTAGPVQTSCTGEPEATAPIPESLTRCRTGKVCDLQGRGSCSNKE